MSLSVIEDIESGKEFERIKQNFTPSPPDPDILANLTEMQTSLEDLQSELHGFLTQYMDKIIGLQTRITTSLTSTSTSQETDAQRTVIPTTTNVRISRHSTVEGQHTIDESLSDRRLSVKALLKVENIPLDAHLHHLQTFLSAQMESIRRLREAPHSSMTHKEEKAPPSSREDNTDKIHEVASSRVNVDLNGTLSIFIFMATLIVVSLLLVITIIGTKHRTPFNVAMFFSFLSLSALLIGIFTMKCILLVPQATKEKRTIESVNFYSQLLEQLHLVAIVLFIISIVITMFIIFTSLAFPFVALFLSGLGALIVFSSIYWEVPITFKNIQYLGKNIRRFRTAVEFVKYTRKTTIAAPLF